MNNEITLLQKAGVFALVCVGALCLSGVYYMFQDSAHQNSKTFSVAGKGEVDVHATKATVNADFVGEGKTSQEATTKLTEMSTKVFKALADAGVKKDDIKTATVNTNPKYEYCYNYSVAPEWCKNNPNQNRIVGYEATQNFSVSIKDNKDMVEKVLGLFPTLGARNVDGPNWEVDNKAAINEARKKAVDEARAKAQSIADSLGMRLGDVTYYSEDQGGGNYPVPMMYAKGAVMSSRIEMAPAMDASVPVSEGTDKVTVNVNVTYELR